MSYKRTVFELPEIFYPQVRTGYETPEALDQALIRIQEAAQKSYPQQNLVTALSMALRQANSVIEGARQRYEALAEKITDDKSKMSEDRYWKVRMEVYAFDTEEQAKAFQNALMEAFMAMPEAAELGSASSVIEEVD